MNFTGKSDLFPEVFTFFNKENREKIAKKHFCTYSFEHAYDILGVIEGADLLVAPAVHDRHGLQTHTLHVRLRGEQEPVVEVVEELVTVGESNVRLM